MPQTSPEYGKAIRILGYATAKITDDNGQRRRVSFPVLSVSDIAQTDPSDPTPTTLPSPP